MLSLHDEEYDDDDYEDEGDDVEEGVKETVSFKSKME